MDYKDTLHLPKTDFPMRGNLPNREPEWLEFWKSIDLQARLDATAGERESFVLHDGPPYANGNIHLGTALNKILKDIVVKSKYMDGYYAPYIPGWDCHGLPIAQKVTEGLRKKGQQEVSSVELRKLCKDYALNFVNTQRDEFMRLGGVGNWDQPYLTLNPAYEAEELRQFAALVEGGHVYRALKPVYWCPAFQTALAEAEVEYYEHTSPSIYVLFPAVDLQQLPELAAYGPFNDDRPLQVLIWTTTPWTLPANLAIAFHPDFQYALVETREHGVLVLAADMLEQVAAETGLKQYKVLGTVPGTAFENRRCRHPFIERDSLCVLADYVTLEQGSGCVHTAPGHGVEDWQTGQRYGLDVLSPVDEYGRFTDEFAPMAGTDVFKANPAICELLQEKGALLWQGEVTHEYPHDWRAKKPIVYRATPQWFISLEHDNLRERLLEAVERVQWVPHWGRDRIHAMISNRQEWCISRQRVWGVPIPAIHDRTTGEVLLDAQVIGNVARVVETRGTDVWFEALEEQDTDGVKELWSAIHNALPDACAGHDLALERDILDVWFDSGVSHHSVLQVRDQLRFPADMYLEGSDQHRGWFQSSLTTAIAAGHGEPFKSVLTHGYVVDEQGRKQSKSLGNVVRPQEVTNKYGADILRLWVSSEDFRSDISLSWNIVKQLAEAYRRIRNTCRYLIANLHDYQPDRAVALDELLELDRYILLRMQQAETQARDAYRRYEFHRLFHVLNNLCVNDLSSLYLDVIKDRMYCEAQDSRDRRAAQTAMHRIVLSLVRLIAPVLSFTGEEVWQALRGLGLADTESVFLSTWSTDKEWPANDGLLARWGELLRLRSEVARALEFERKAKLIGKSLDAAVQLYIPDENLRALAADYRDREPAGDNLASLLIVSQVELVDSPPTGDGVFTSEELTGLVVRVAAAPDAKCERCWNFRPSVGADSDHPTLCARCAGVVGQPV